jgi:phospholipase C
VSLLDDVDQLVIVMLENRSFDSLLGYLSLDAFAGERAEPVNGLKTADLNAGRYDNPIVEGQGQRRRPFEFPADTTLQSDLPHGRWDIMRQLALQNHTATMTGFVEAQYPAAPTPPSPTCMGYFTKSHTPMTHFLAVEYRVCDRWFSPIPADTHPNRLMAVSGYTVIDTTGSLVRQDLSILSYLKLHGFESSVGVYAKRASFYSMFYDYALSALRYQAPFRTYGSFATDWATPPTGPKVWVIEPAYRDSPLFSNMTQGPPDDNHPPSPVAFTENFLRDVYLTVTSNAARWARTLMIVTYDEHGGFFDHEPALPIKTPPPQPNLYLDFPCTGPRVPAFLISPYAGRGTTCSLPMDHTSVLRMIAEKFVPGVSPSFSSAVASRPVYSPWAALDRTTPRDGPPPAPPPAMQLPPEGPPDPAPSAVAKTFLAAATYAHLTGTAPG